MSTPLDKGCPRDIAHDEFTSKETSLPGPLDTRYATLTRWQAFKTFWRAMIFCGVAGWAGLNDGFEGQLPSNILPLKAFVATMADTVIDGEPAISGLTVSFLGGFPAMTQIFGQLCGGPISNRFGRKVSMYTFTALFLLGSLLEITAQNWRWFLGATCVSKLGLGIAQTTLIVYLAEIAPFQLRGAGMVAYQLFLAGGQLVGAIASQIQSAVNKNAWRPLIASEFVITGMFCLMLPFLPESHIFHIRNGDEAKAKRSMLRLYNTAPNYDVDHEYLVVRNQIDAERRQAEEWGTTSYTEIFRGINLRRTIAAVVGTCSQPLAGAPLLFSYATYFFAIVGVQDPFLVTVIIDIVLLVTIGISMYLCEIVGRRRLMLSGCFCMFWFSLGLAITGSFSSQASSQTALGLLICWVIAYSWSAAPVGFIAGVAFGSQSTFLWVTLASWTDPSFIFYWIVPILISPDRANLGVRAAYVFAGLVVPVGVLVFFFYPETTGRTYVELDELYGMRVPARKFRTTVTSTESRGLKTKQVITHAV